MIYYVGEIFSCKDEYGYSIADYINSELAVEGEVVKTISKNNNYRYDIFILCKTLNEEFLVQKIKIYKDINSILEVECQKQTNEENASDILQEIEKNTINSYSYLAKIYDLLQERMDYSVFDHVLKKFLLPNKSFLELGSGSGNVTSKLIDLKQNVVASDISCELLKKLQSKFKEIEVKHIDILKLNLEEKFDNIGMFLDTLNYIEPRCLVEVFERVYKALNKSGYFIFDIHTLQKQEEFDGYIEEIDYKEFYFRWLSYKVEENIVEHNFLFVNNKISIEKHIQYIYPLDFYREIYKDKFEEIDVQTINNRHIIILQRKGIN